MERGASYSLHDDRDLLAKSNGPQDAAVMQSSSGYSANVNSGYQPPTLHHRAVAMGASTRTGRIIDRADTLFQRSKGRWKYVFISC